MAELLSKAKDQVVEALSQATAAVSLGATSGPFSPCLELRTAASVCARHSTYAV